ncbi:MAG TPA: lactate utilization protein B [Acidimicrobiia bacterium]|nr:lactate utilization protein B [Acidimicrobiia bacterium]
MPHGIVTPGATIKERAAAAVADPQLQRALRNLDIRLHTAGRVQSESPELKDRAAAIRREVIANLEPLLDQLQASLEALGAVVHRCATPEDARAVVLDLARREGVRRVVKSKSMATEEIDLADTLAANGIDALETDLGEYIVQLAGERPSHIITPVIHKTLPQIADVMSTEAGEALPAEREELTAWARTRLRPRFAAAEMGITGANYAIAETGTIVLVTNEGNGRYCTTLPRIQVVVAGIEKVLPRFADLATMLPVLTRSATGQGLSNYVAMLTGPRRPGETDGPEQLHVILLDHNRRSLVGTAYEDMLACIRCGACLNVCPVYRRIGGHAYDSVYPGPMGKVLTPLLTAGETGRDLPGASSLCGACTEACPVEIPLADLLVRLRADLRAPGPPVALAHRGPGARGPVEAPAHGRLPGEGFATPTSAAPLPASAPPPGRSRRRTTFGIWARAWETPAGYRASTAAARWGAALLGGRRGWLRRAPGLAGWTESRDLPAPAAPRFRERWAARAAGRETW